MKYIKVFNLISGNERVITTFEHFKNRVTAEMSDAYEVVEKYPNIGTVKDGSRLKYAQELDYILNNVLVESENWEDSVLAYTEKRKVEISAFIDKLPIEDCVGRCIGLRQANSLCENIIDELDKYAKAL